MKKGAKVALWVLVSVTIVAGGIGAYLLLAPKDGQTKIKAGKNYTYKKGQGWIDNTVTSAGNEYTNTSAGNEYTNPSTAQPKPSGSTSVKDLQTKLNSMGANLTVDGVMGSKTKAAMSKYGIDINGNSTSNTGTPIVVTTPSSNPILGKTVYAKNNNTSVFYNQALTQSVVVQQGVKIGIANSIVTLKNQQFAICTDPFTYSVVYIRVSDINS